jgi:hypothetical protein
VVYRHIQPPLFAKDVPAIHLKIDILEMIVESMMVELTTIWTAVVDWTTGAFAEHGEKLSYRFPQLMVLN